MTDKQTVFLQLDLTPIQGALIKKFHREIIMGSIDEVEEAFTIIFDREPEPIEAITLKQFCMVKAKDWGSSDLLPPNTTTRSFGVIKGGRK